MPAVVDDDDNCGVFTNRGGLECLRVSAAEFGFYAVLTKDRVGCKWQHNHPEASSGLGLYMTV